MVLNQLIGGHEGAELVTALPCSNQAIQDAGQLLGELAAEREVFPAVMATGEAERSNAAYERLGGFVDRGQAVATEGQHRDFMMSSMAKCIIIYFMLCMFGNILYLVCYLGIIATIKTVLTLKICQERVYCISCSPQ